MKSPFEEIVDELAGSGIPVAVIERLPRRWEKLGDVLLMKIDDALIPHADDVLPVYARILRVKAVLRDLGIEGRFREPRVDLLYGDSTETLHRENGVLFHMDPALVMFSSGNIDERKRMAGAGSPEETVVDMFAGIGYFIMPMAVHSNVRGIAFELNPASYAFLERNVEANGVAGNIEPVLGDCMDAPEGIADRVIMGYFDDTDKFLEKAMRIVSPDGGMIHAHSVCPEELLSSRPEREAVVAAASTGRSISSIEIHRVKSYAPGVEHIVLDIVVE